MSETKDKKMSSKVHPALDYRARLQSDPRYDLSDVYPQTGDRTLTIDPNVGRSIEFELPPRCINLARSKLEFNLEIQDMDGQNADAWEALVHSDAISFVERVEVFTRSGVRLMDLDRQQLWSKISNSYFNDPDAYSASQIGNNLSVSSGKHRHRVHTAQPWIQKISDPADQKTAYNYMKETPEGLEDHFRTEFQVPTDKLSAKYSLDLGSFRDSILAVDKSLYFGGQVLNVKLHIAGHNDWISKRLATAASPIFDTNDGNYLVTAAQSDQQVTSLPTTVSVAMTSLCVRCAFESNPVLISQIKSKVMSDKGLKLFIPYVHSFQETRPTPSDGKLTQIVRLNRGHGLRVQRLVFTATNSYANNINLANYTKKFGTSNCVQLVEQKNAGGAIERKFMTKAKIASYYTTLNNRRLQERDIIIQENNGFYTLDSYNYMKPVLEGSISDSIEGHLENWAHVDAFDAYNCKKKDFTNVVAGLPLSDDMQYAVNVDQKANADNLILSTFAVCQRSLQLKADSISLV